MAKLPDLTVGLKVDELAVELLTGRLRQSADALEGDGCDCETCMERYFPKLLESQRDIG